MFDGVGVSMSVESLHIALQQSFSPDASLRDPAEEKMKNLKYVNGATTMLLQVAAEKQVCPFLLHHEINGALIRCRMKT